MKYYVTADVHGFFTPMRKALAEAGFFDDPAPRRLVILGDIMDRGIEARAMQDFLLELLQREEVILIRGNHEDLFERMVTVDCGFAVQPHLGNRTYDTALQLTGIPLDMALTRPLSFADAAKETPFYQTILPACRDFFETERYVFVHGWLPCFREPDGVFRPRPDWRNASPEAWREARWYNGMDAARMVTEPGKTVLCGHWHTSYGHARYEGRGPEFGEGADFSPYTAPGILAMDACTARSGQVNCIVLED